MWQGCVCVCCYFAIGVTTVGVQLPGHFVAVDRSQKPLCFGSMMEPPLRCMTVRCNKTFLVARTMKAVVLGIRGTTTLSDALTDAVGEATEETSLELHLLSTHWANRFIVHESHWTSGVFVVGSKMPWSTCSQSNAGAPFCVPTFSTENTFIVPMCHRPVQRRSLRTLGVHWNKLWKRQAGGSSCKFFDRNPMLFSLPWLLAWW